MDKLYIIGNGFDIYHGLETKYSTFGTFLKENYTTIYDRIIEYYGFTDLDINDPSIYEDILWAEFEKSLALLDSDTVLEAHSDSLARPGAPGFRDRDWGTFAIDMELVVEDLTVNLFEAFKNFILNIKYPELLINKKLPLDKDALYLSFNYTDTLERYYGIPEKSILYIHGKAKLDETVLILGHGVNPENFTRKEPQPLEGLDEEGYEQWIEYMSDNYDHSFELGKTELLNYFSGTFKETKIIIDNNTSFFNRLKKIQNVVVLGHSLSEVDIPYFVKVFNSIQKHTLWLATYYGNNEKNTHKEALTNLGVKEGNIKLITIDELF